MHACLVLVRACMHVKYVLRVCTFENYMVSVHACIVHGEGVHVQCEERVCMQA